MADVQSQHSWLRLSRRKSQGTPLSPLEAERRLSGRILGRSSSKNVSGLQTKEKNRSMSGRSLRAKGSSYLDINTPREKFNASGKISMRSSSRFVNPSLNRTKSAPPEADGPDAPFASLHAGILSGTDLASSRFLVSGTLGTTVSATISNDHGVPVGRLQGRQIARELTFYLRGDGRGNLCAPMLSVRWNLDMDVMDVSNCGLYPAGIGRLARMQVMRKRVGLRQVGDGYIGEICATSGSVMAKEYAVLVGHELVAKVVRTRGSATSWMAQIEIIGQVESRERALCLGLVSGIEAAFFQGQAWRRH